jgi:translocation and assembly module TamB
MNDRVSIDLAIGRTQQFPLRGRIAIDGLDLSSLVPAAPLEPGDGTTVEVASGLPRAKLGGELLFTDGGLLDPASLDASITLSEVELGRGDLVLENRGPVVVVIKNGVASVDRARFDGPESRIRVQGQYTLPRQRDDGGLALSIHGDVGLRVLTRITPAVVEADGRVQTHLTLSGLISDPEVYGDAQLEGGFLRMAGLDAPIEDLGARVTFSARSILIEDVHGRAAGGTIHGSGEATLSDGALERYSVDLSGEDLAFVPTDGLEIALAADVELAWARGERLPTLGGEVRVERLAYTHPFDIGPTIGSITRTQRAEVARYDPDADRLALDVRIVDEQAFVVRNNLVEAEVAIDDSRRPFRFVGTDQRFGAIGDMHFTHGRVFFRNATFDIQQGTLAFDDETSIDPRFDVRAHTDIVRRTTDALTAPRWRIALEAEGTADSFEIRTNSDPDLPQDDILMLLAVGMTRSELGQLQLGDVGSTLALEALAQVTGVDREVRRAVPLIDDFRFSSAYSARSGRTEPQVSIGNRIADRVRISATTSLGATPADGARDFQATIDMQLTDESGVQCSYDTYGMSTTSSFGNVGCDLRWRLDFE